MSADWTCPKGTITVQATFQISVSVVWTITTGAQSVGLTMSSGSFTSKYGTLMVYSCNKMETSCLIYVYSGTQNYTNGLLGWVVSPTGYMALRYSSNTGLNSFEATWVASVPPCKDCAPGTVYQNVNECSLCGPGKYQLTSSCVDCALGYYQTGSGRSACDACGAGSYQALPAQPACTACGGGTYQSLSGQINCTLCEAGLYQSLTGKTLCGACDAGTYQSLTGKSACGACDTGAYQSLTGKTNCTLCNPGTYQSLTGKTACVLCNAGTYQSLAGQTVCLLCAVGTGQVKTGQTLCSNCTAGTYTSYMGQGACVGCGPGTFQLGSGMTFCPQCATCDSHAYSTRTCSSITGDETCACRAGYVGDGYSCANCSDCGLNKYRKNCQATNPGECADCVASCAPTKFLHNCGGTSPGTCQDCPVATCVIGTYLSGCGTYSVGACHTCKDTSCSYGSYIQGCGLQSPGTCVICPRGFYSTMQGATSSDDCAAIPVGSYNPGDGDDGGGGDDDDDGGGINPFWPDPLPRPAPQDPPAVPTPNPPQAGPGYCAVNGLIYACIAGTYQSGYGFSYCDSCPQGAYQSGTGSPGCSACGRGRFQSHARSITCPLCDVGTYQTGTGKSDCVECQGGTYQSATQATAPCGQCDAGRYASGTGLSLCLACSAGAYQTGLGYSACVQCAAGAYQPGSQSLSCPKCDAGKYASGTGLSLCLACSAGAYQTGTGLSSCVLCALGTYQTGSQSVSCPKCDVGKYASGSGLSQCLLCSAGAYQTGTGLAQCDACGKGSYQTGSGSSACRGCAQGLYGTLAGATDANVCQPCAAPAYSDVMGASACLACQVCQADYYLAGCGGGSAGEGCQPCTSVVFPAGNYLVGCGLFSSGTVTPCSRACPKGDYLDGCSGVSAGKCQTCMQGAYSDAAGATTSAACTSCLPGSYQSVPGTPCAACEVGLFGNTSRATACRTCPQGAYASQAGQTACLLCDYGQRQDQPGQTSCRACAAGTYQSLRGQLDCADCALGEYQANPGQVGCVRCHVHSNTSQVRSASVDLCVCVAGYAGQGVCELCREGFYCLGGASATACEAGSVQPETGQTGCQQCDPGFYQDQPAHTVCRGCDKGSYQSGIMATACLDCPRGTFENAVQASACQQCIPGEYQDTPRQLACVLCAIGTYQSLSGMSACRICPAGEYQPSSGMSACRACSIGTYKVEGVLGDCTPCPEGSYQDDPSSSFCHLCTPGQYQGEKGTTLCEDCVEGSFADSEGFSVCPLCPEGQYQGESGQSSCIPSERGSFVGQTGQTAATPCPRDTFQPLPGQSFCSSCPIGHFQSGEGGTVCDQCVPGTFKSVETQFLCQPCDSGAYASQEGQTACLACAAGYYSNAPAATYCYACDFGRFNSGPGWSGCEDCAPGSYTNAYRQTVCQLCAPGLHTNLTGQFLCLACDSGSYASLFGQPLCTLCDRGAFQSMTQQTACDDCPTGTYTNFRGGSNCADCPAGLFLNEALSECHQCAPGSFSGAPQRTHCDDCTPGWFASAYRSTACEQCPPGAGASAGASSACLACAPGDYQSLPAQTGCLACATEAYSTVPGRSVCLACAAGEFSNPGDLYCSQCTSFTTPLVGDCPAVTQAPPAWLTLYGPSGGEDLCLAGLSQVDGLEISLENTWAAPGVVCAHTLRVLGRPELTRTWSASSPARHPPAARATLYAYNGSTFYPDACLAGGGLAFAFTLEDGEGGLRVSDQQPAYVRLRDAGGALLESVACQLLPDPLARVPLGQCFTSFCPTLPVLATLEAGAVLSEPVMLSPLRLPAPALPPLFAIDLRVVGATRPFLPGDVVSIEVTAPPGEAVVFFGFGADLAPGFATYENTTSEGYLVRAGAQGGQVSCQGAGSGSLLGTLRLAIPAATGQPPGVRTLLCVSGWEVTLGTGATLGGPASGRGYTARADGCVDVLFDRPRVVALVAAASKSHLVGWQPTTFPLQIHAVGVYNVMGRAEYVQPTCRATSSWLLASLNCRRIEAYPSVGQGGSDQELVAASYPGAQTYWVPVRVYSPGDPVEWAAPGRRKVLCNLTTPGRQALNVDITPMLGIEENLPQTCILPASKLVLLAPGYSMGWGAYAFPPAVVSPSTPELHALIMSEDGCVLEDALTTDDPTSLEVVSHRLVRLVPWASASRCVGVAGLGRVPVLHPSPAGLRLALSATTLVPNTTESAYIPSSALLLDVLLGLTDGTEISILNSPRLRLAPGALGLANLSVSARAEGAYSLGAAYEGVRCVAGGAAVRVVGAGVVRAALACPGCPPSLSLPDDPLAVRYPERFPSRVPVAAFRASVLLADGLWRAVEGGLTLSGAGEIRGGDLVPTAGGSLAVAFNGSDPVAFSVVARQAVGAALLCDQSACEGVSVSSDPALQGPPFLLPATTRPGLLLTLLDGTTLLMQAAWPGYVNFSVDGAQDPPANLTVGPHVAGASLAAAWRLPAELRGTFQAVGVAGLATPGAVGAVYQLHCTGVWQQGAFAVSARLTSGAEGDVTDWAALWASPPLVLDSARRFHATGAGAGVVTAAFGGRTAVQVVVASNFSVVATSAALRSVPPLWTGPRGQRLAHAWAVAPSLDPGWTDYATLLGGLLSAASAQPGAVHITPAYAELLSDFYEPVLISYALPACETHTTQHFSQWVEPHLAPALPGDPDAGPALGLAVPPADSGDFRVPLFVLAPSPLKAVLLEVFYPPAALAALACAPGPALQDTLCQVMAEGRVRVVGSDLQATGVGRLLIAVLSLRPLAAGLAVLELDVREARLGVGVTQARRNLTVRLRGQAAPVHLPAHASPGARRRLLSAGNVWGDTEGVGLFSSLSVQFLEEVMYLARFSGPQTVCVTRCQSTADLTPWQRKMLNPVNDPSAGPRPPSGVARLFLLNVLVGNYHFLAEWSANGTQGVRFAARLVDMDGNPDPPRSSVRVELASPRNRDFAPPAQALGDALYVYLSAGGAESVGPVYAERVPLAVWVRTEDPSALSVGFHEFRFYPTEYFAYLEVTGIQQAGTTTPLPETTPMPISRPTLLSACCDVTLAPAQSAAHAFFPAGFSLASVSLLLEDGRNVSVPSGDPRLVPAYDKALLAFTPPGAWSVVRNLRVVDPLTTRVRLAYLGLGAGVNVTIVDVQRFSVQAVSPPGAGLDELVLRRIHCVPGLYQSLTVRALAYIPGIGSLPAGPLQVSLTNPLVANVTGEVVTGARAGTTDLVVSWRGFVQTLPGVRVADESVLFSVLGDCAYAFTQTNVTQPLRLDLLQTGADGVTATPFPDVFGRPYGVPWARIVGVEAPPSVRVEGGAVTALANSEGLEALVLTLAQCDSQPAMVLACPLLVNFEPEAGDVDVGNREGLMLMPNETSMEVRLRVAGDAFFVELLVESVLGCDSAYYCTCNDPVGTVWIAGLSPANGTLVAIATLSMEPLAARAVSGRVERLSGGQSVRRAIAAGRLGQGREPPAPPALVLVDLASAARSDDPAGELLVLVRQRRVVLASVRYATDGELSVLVRLADRASAPDDTQSRVSFRLDPPGLVPFGGEVPHVMDGWYGVEFLGPVPRGALSVWVTVTTLDCLGGTTPSRTHAYPTPHAQVRRMGLPSTQCPRTAYDDGEVIACYLLSIPMGLTLSTQAIQTRVACKISIIPSRVFLAIDLPAKTLRLRVVLESLLRMREANALLLDTQVLASLLGAEVARVERCERAYAHYPAEPLPACPNGSYFKGGGYYPLPPHAHALPDCYGFECDADYGPDPAHPGHCAPAYVDDNVFWAVITLVSSFILAVAILTGVVRYCCLFGKPEPEVIEQEEDLTLPVGVDDKGRLVFEASASDTEEEEED
jgi:hypothetical protein